MNSANNEDEMRPEYDIRGGVRGKYLERYRKGVKVHVTSSTLEFKGSISVTNSMTAGSGVASVEREIAWLDPQAEWRERAPQPSLGDPEAEYAGQNPPRG